MYKVISTYLLSLSLSLLFVLASHAQSKKLRVIYPDDTLVVDLIYKDTDSLKNGKLIAYFKENPEQEAYVKNYYFGKQSGVYKAFYPNGRLMIFSVYERGMRNGDYAYYGPEGNVLIKAKYKDGQRHGYYINKIAKHQGRYKQGKRNGKWEFNVGSPSYKKVYYSEGQKVPMPGIFSRAINTVSGAVPKRSSSKEIPDKKVEGSYYDMYDTLYLASKESDSVKAYRVYFLPYDSLLHPSLRKAYFVDDPEQTAVVKYLVDGVQNGIFQIFYPNGNLYQYGYYDFGKLTDDWKQYSPNGQLRVRGRYKNGKKHGKWMYEIGTENYNVEKYKDGVLKSKN